MPDQVYDASKLIGATFKAAATVAAYFEPYDNSQIITYYKAGQVIGVLSNYYQQLPTYGRNFFYWEFKDGRGVPFYTRQVGGYYDTNFFQQQGILTVQQELEKQELDSLPWYEQLVKKYGVWILGAVVASAAIKGYLSRPQK